ncbi:etoposide-induced protein 2.4 homolog isoform X2 [Nilaparvata lugens]|uniref:etoposide-induced protein 2.4 homolog isoform X1 n=1 Tax=Nilaparvata lugens TaxID=108931 RepID=UPI00193D5262|nr:etoposide-induced protein 2.4 homolog isoform X1 [Nilaparvata lugens]XP_039299828.1 etoposide-induced protein 2.4 homolog isoform X2 [Nilaparvata lugens]
MALTEIAKTVLKGLCDSLKGTITIFYLDKHIKDSRTQHNSPSRNLNLAHLRISSRQSLVTSKVEEPKILWRTFQCCLLNGGVFWLSLIMFEYLLLPTLQHMLLYLEFNNSSNIWEITKLCLNWTFGMIWVLPLFILSKVINSLWFQDIADSAYRFSRGRPTQTFSVSKLVADNLFSIMIQTFFLVQCMLVSKIPHSLISLVLFHVHMSLLYSLYSFEYKWYNMGWELHKRLTYIENNWSYFLGFGLPLSVFTAIPSSYLISGCVFSMLFPLFIISANEAEPVTNVL